MGPGPWPTSGTGSKRPTQPHARFQEGAGRHWGERKSAPRTFHTSTELRSPARHRGAPWSPKRPPKPDQLPAGQPQTHRAAPRPPLPGSLSGGGGGLPRTSLWLHLPAAVPPFPEDQGADFARKSWDSFTAGRQPDEPPPHVTGPAAGPRGHEPLQTTAQRPPRGSRLSRGRAEGRGSRVPEPRPCSHEPVGGHPLWTGRRGGLRPAHKPSPSGDSQGRSSLPSRASGGQNPSSAA